MTRYLLQYQGQAVKIPVGREFGDIATVHVRTTNTGITMRIADSAGPLVEAFVSGLENLTRAYGVDTLANLKLKQVFSDTGSPQTPATWEVRDYERAVARLSHS